MSITGTADPAISINTLCLAPAPLDRHVGQVARLGVTAIGLTLEEVVDFGAAAAAHLLRQTGLTVATLTHRAFGYATPDEATTARTRLLQTIAVGQAIGAKTITMTTGGRGQLHWLEAVERFAQEIAPCAQAARDAGIVLSLEPTSHLYADVSIAHRLSDTVRIVRAAGIGLGIDLFACWFDADIDEAIAAAAPYTALVQVSDYVYGDRSLPCRAIPGDGMAGLDRLIQQIHAAGFRGYYDIEVIGPRIEGRAEIALARSITYLRGLVLEG